MSKVNVNPIRQRVEQRCTDLTAALVDREALLALYGKQAARITTLEAQMEQAREALEKSQRIVALAKRDLATNETRGPHPRMSLSLMEALREGADHA